MLLLTTAMGPIINNTGQKRFQQARGIELQVALHEEEIRRMAQYYGTGTRAKQLNL